MAKPDQGHQGPVLDALSEECRSISETLGVIQPDDWTRAALGEWNLAELVAHLTGGIDRIRSYLDEPVPDGQLVDPVEYFRYDPSAVAQGIAQRARERAADTEPSALPGIFGTTCRAALERASKEPPERVLTTFRGPMRLTDYLRTRVLEAVVHHIDVRAAIGLEPASTAAATQITVGILEGLLGSPRPGGMDDSRFILAATGRIPLDDARFPVMG